MKLLTMIVAYNEQKNRRKAMRRIFGELFASDYTDLPIRQIHDQERTQTKFWDGSPETKTRTIGGTVPKSYCNGLKSKRRGRRKYYSFRAC